MKHFTSLPVIVAVLALISSCMGPTDRHRVTDNGAITRFDTTRSIIYLAFTGHAYAEGGTHIQRVLQDNGISASFFFTGDFYRNPDFESLVRGLINDGHYLGAHSDRHLLYCSWEDRDSLLVTREEFEKDLLSNYAEMERFGIEKQDAPYFMPPYEWYNREIANWTRALGLTLINFSPGTTSNADYTWPELGSQYRDNATIYRNILEYEEEYGMNGFILLIHIGTDPRRQEKFYHLLDALLQELEGRGYRFQSLREAG